MLVRSRTWTYPFCISSRGRFTHQLYNMYRRLLSGWDEICPEENIYVVTTGIAAKYIAKKTMDSKNVLTKTNDRIIRHARSKLTLDKKAKRRKCVESQNPDGNAYISIKFNLEQNPASGNHQCKVL